MRRLSCFAGAVLAAACGSGGSGAVDAKNSALTNDSGNTASQTAAFASIAVDPLAGGFTDSLDAAKKAQAGIKNSFSNPACVSVQLDSIIPTKVVATLSSCSGGFGLKGASGQVAFTYASQGSGLTVQMASQNLNVDGGTLQLAAVVTVTNQANVRSVSVQTTTQATSANGGTYQHAGQFSAVWDTMMCLTLDGQFATVKDGQQLATVISGYKRCKAMCPQSGKVQVAFTNTSSGEAGAIEITYDGTSTAKVTQASSTGVSAQGSVQLSCG